VCGFKNYRPEKPGKSAVLHKPDNETASHENCPKRSAHLLAGGIGAFIMAIAAIILGILPIFNAMHDGWMRFDTSGIYLLYITGTLLFLAGSCVLMAGLYGLFKHYGGYQGLVALMFSLISPIILLMFTYLAIDKERSSYGYYSHSYSYYTIGPEIWIGHIFVGIMFILIGMSWRSINYKIGLEEPNLPVGSLFILAGFLFIVFIGFIGIPWIMISVAGIAAGVLFLLGRSGMENIPLGRSKPKPHWSASSPDYPSTKY